MRCGRVLVVLGSLAMAATLVGCGEPMRMEGEMSMEGEMTMDADLTGSMRIEGPIEIRMQGPSITYEGVFIPESLLDRVIIDSTRKDWLLAVFGDPTRQATLDDGSEIWTWAYLPMRQEGALVTFLEIGGGEDGEPAIQSSTTFVHLRDGVVIDRWRD